MKKLHRIVFLVFALISVGLMAWAIVVGVSAPDAGKIADIVGMASQYDENGELKEDELGNPLPVLTTAEGIEAMGVATINQMRKSDATIYGTTLEKINNIESKIAEIEQQLASNNGKALNEAKAKVAELEDLISTCKKYGKFPYITVRDTQIDLCVNEVYRLLKKYDMVNNCIVNSFSEDTLKAMRALDENICLSLVFGPDEPLTRKEVDIAASIGNCVVCVFWWKAAQLEGKLYEQSKEAIEYAQEKGVVLHIAHGADKESYSLGLKMGFKGFQCLTSNAFC
jgi:hypothetical protein